LIPVEVRPLERDELVYAAGVGARGMRDNPMTIGVLGDDASHRHRSLDRAYRAFLPMMALPPLAGFRGDHVVGIAGMAPPGRCQLSTSARLRLLPRTRPRLRDMRRTFQWLSDWERRDIDEPHVHLGPVAVEPGLQGLGIGSQIMQHFAERMDDEDRVAYLETDKRSNVAFYERFGFETIDEGVVLGVPNWFMRREPA
jgi:ribosomal protein S18 acetylase RimI-like enzyme